MIVSFKHRFVFCKARKVGGTSVELALSTICGEDDIVTPVSPVDEIERLRMGGRPQNYARDRSKEARFIDQVLNATPEDRPSISPGGVRFDNHTRFAKIERKIDLTGMRAIGVVRSPYGLIVSRANHSMNFNTYRIDGRPMISTPQQVRDKVDAMIVQNQGDLRSFALSDFYRNAAGEVTIEALRQEHLQADFSAFLASIGVADIELPTMKLGLGLNARQCHDLLRPDQREIIRSSFSEDIKNFGEGLE